VKFSAKMGWKSGLSCLQASWDESGQKTAGNEKGYNEGVSIQKVA